MAEPHHPRVFISYSHDSPEHADRVRELSDRLRQDGIDCLIDQYVVSPQEGWPLWMDRQIRDADFVLLICTEIYHRRVMREEGPGKGLGVGWEGHLIYQHIYNAGVNNAKFIPVLFETSDPSHIPVPLQGVLHYRPYKNEEYEALYRILTGQPEHVMPVLGRLREMPPLERKQDFFTGPLSNLPFERNAFFTGREKILISLRQSLVSDSATALTHTAAISGLGGVGKTQTALEYAYRYGEHYRAIFWVRSDSELALTSGFVEIARVVGLPEKETQKAEETVGAVKKWLETRGEWLLIFDNADEPEIVKRYRPRFARGHILLTSRAAVFDVLGITKPIEMEAMMPEEALKFLFARTGRKQDNGREKEAAAQLAAEVGYLPLALEQAGAYITAKKARFEDYIKSYRRREIELLKESRPVAGDYPESVVTTWEINFRAVEKESEAAAELLGVSAYFGPDAIPYELVVDGKSELGDRLSAALADVEDDPLVLNRIMEPLARYSLIRIDNENQTYNIHRLVQEVVKERMEAEEQRAWAERSIRALNIAFDDVEFENWPKCERLISHAKAAAKHIKKWGIEIEEAARLLNQAAVYSKEQGQYSEAEPLYKRSLAISEKSLGPDHPSLATGLENYADLLRAMHREAEAEKLEARARAIRAGLA